MSRIEIATPDDVVRIGQMLRRFYLTHGIIYGIKYDHSSCLCSVLKVMQDGVCLVGQGSCAGALIIPFPFNQKAQVAQVLFWFVENRREIAIFDRLIHECKNAGATHINVATVAPKHVGKRFYAVRGLSLAEAQYLGPLDLACKEARKG